MLLKIFFHQYNQIGYLLILIKESIFKEGRPYMHIYLIELDHETNITLKMLKKFHVKNQIK